MIKIRKKLIKAVLSSLMLVSSFSVFAQTFIDPVKDGRYRSAHNKFIFGSSTDDKYRIPSMEKLNNGDIVFLLSAE